MYDVVPHTSYFFYLPGPEKSEEEERPILVIEGPDRISLYSETSSVRVSVSMPLDLLVVVKIWLSKENGEELVAVEGSMDSTHLIWREWCTMI